MTDPAAPTPPSPSPTPAPTPAPAPSPAPSPAPTPQAVARPEWLPEAHWDGTANSIKPEFGAHYQELTTAAEAQRTFAEQQAALAARKPEDIKIEVKLPDTVKVPDGLQIQINDKDPRVPVLRDLAIKRGLSQDTIDDLVAFDAQMQIEAHTAEQTRIAAEDAKLGANAKDRKAAVGAWLKGMKDRNEITAEEHAAVTVYAIDASAVTALEKIIAKANGTVPGHHPAPPPSPQPKSVAERLYPHLASGLPPASRSA